MSPTILITRPDASAAPFADQLRARLGCGPTIVFSPLMRIENFGELPNLSAVKVLLFTSRNGVDAYAAQSERRDIACYCVGDATAARARELGLEAIPCAGTAESVVARLIADKIEGPCLHIRGEHGVGDIAVRLSASGILTDEVVLYRQVRQSVTDEAKLLLQREKSVVLPLFSPRTARLLFSEVDVTAPLKIIAMSENVANEVPKSLSGCVMVAESPDAEAMIGAIEAAL